MSGPIAPSNSATASPLYQESDRALLVKILCELRVLNLLMSNQMNSSDDISRLRAEVMSEIGSLDPATSTDL